MTDKWKSIEKYTYLSLALALLIVVIISSSSYKSLAKTKNDFEWVVRTREVLLNLSYFISNLKDAESEQRDYLLTGDEHYLERVLYVEQEVKEHFASLRKIATNNTQQQKKLDVLEGLVQKKLVELKKMTALRKEKGVEAAKDAVLATTGKRIMDEIREVVLQMDRDERALLIERTQKVAARIRLLVVVRVTGITIAFVTAALVIIRVNHWVSELKGAEKKQMDIMEMKSNFISMASHELRTPLTAIQEGIAIVLDGSAGRVNDEQKEFLDIAKRNVDRLARLIDNALDFQKFDSGRVDFHMEAGNINDVVKEIYDTMLPLVKEKGLDFVVNLDDGLPSLRFDMDKIIQVLTNIVNNSIKFTEAGEIKLSTSKHNNSVLVSVSDTGYGIKKEDLSRVFNRFEQVLNIKGRSTGGTGLGLAISKEIIKHHNGKIWVESEYGKETTFQFILPIQERRG